MSRPFQPVIYKHSYSAKSSLMKILLITIIDNILHNDHDNEAVFFVLMLIMDLLMVIIMSWTCCELLVY